MYPDFANMDPRLANSMGNQISGGNIGKQFNEAAGIRTSGHIHHPNLLHNGGPGDINVQGTNISMEAMLAQGLLQRQNAGMYHQNQKISTPKEEFLPLPGFRGSAMDYPVEMHPKEQLHDYTLSQLQPQHLPAHNMELGAAGTKPLNPMGTGVGPYDEILRQYELNNLTQLQAQQMQATDTFNTKDHAPKRPTQLPIDPYGMLGLLRVMKPSRHNLVSAHGLGIDLTTLGLNLTQSDDLHKDFLSPFSDKSVKEVQDRQFMVPECYNAKRADLQPSWFSRFRPGTLFYIFYSMPKDVAQLYAAHELMNREWIYHKEHRLWLMRDKKKGLLVKTNTYERGAFKIFDPKVWQIINQDNFVLKYELIEKRPALPSQPSRN
ncbi:hypothetical protein QQ045_006820 [Rhodiola kirilowii]